MTGRTLPIYGVTAGAVLLTAAALAGPLSDSSLTPVLPFGLLALALLVLLCVTRPMVAALLGFALLAVVKIEPAPVDVVFATLIAVTLVTCSVRPKIPVEVEAVLLLIGALTILSSVNAIDTRRAATYGAISLYLLVLSVWLTWLFTNDRVTRLAMRAYIAVAALSAIAVVMALYAHLPGGDALLYDAQRGQGLFKDPNVYSAFLVPPTVIVLEEIGRPSLLPPRRLLTVPLFILLSAGTVVAFSRAAWLNLAVASFVVITASSFRSGGVRVAAKAVGGLCLAGAAGFGLLTATGSMDFLRQRSQLEAYDQQRFGNQDTAFHRMTEHIFGHGPGQAEKSLDIATHSLFARSAFEQGMLGIALVVVLIIATTAYAFAFARRDGRIGGVGSAALLGSWLGLVANSFFIDTIHWRHLYVVAALIWAGYMTRSSEPQRRALTTP
jgi:hypothetical protein